MPEPAIAVVVPVRGAATTIAATVGAVVAEVARIPSPVEVVVVDDASTDGTADAAQRAFDHSDVAGRVARRIVRGGPNAARNTGIAATSAAVLVFLDGDDLPLRGVVAALAAAVDSPDVIAGGTYLIPGPRGRRSTVSASTRAAFGFPYAVGGALATSRVLLERCGGFDESIGRGGTEVELCIRAQRLLGARIVPVDDACVLHRVPLTALGRARLHYARERGHRRVLKALAADGVAAPRRTPGGLTWSQRADRAGSWTLLAAEVAGRAVGRLAHR